MKSMDENPLMDYFECNSKYNHHLVGENGWVNEWVSECLVRTCTSMLIENVD